MELGLGLGLGLPFSPCVMTLEPAGTWCSTMARCSMASCCSLRREKMMLVLTAPMIRAIVAALFCVPAGSDWRSPPLLRFFVLVASAPTPCRRLRGSGLPPCTALACSG